MTTSGVLVSFVIPSLIYIKLEENKWKKIFVTSYAIFSLVLGIICFILEVSILFYKNQVITTIRRIIDLFN
jgi:hypothetical protein